VADTAQQEVAGVAVIDDTVPLRVLAESRLDESEVAPTLVLETVPERGGSQQCLLQTLPTRAECRRFTYDVLSADQRGSVRRSDLANI